MSSGGEFVRRVATQKRYGLVPVDADDASTLQSYSTFAILKMAIEFDILAEWSKACDSKSLLRRRRRFKSCRCRFLHGILFCGLLPPNLVACHPHSLRSDLGTLAPWPQARGCIS